MQLAEGPGDHLQRVFGKGLDHLGVVPWLRTDQVEDARGGLSTAELAPSIILSESFEGN